jgi:cold shock CspA family protein
VLLGRPDILIRTGLHNINTKLKDNSVFLNWQTAYKDYRTSQLFKVADRILSAQQTPATEKIGDAWDHYFPFNSENVMDPDPAGQGKTSSFLSFLRFSYYRPRDLNRMLATMQEFLQRKHKPSDFVTAEDFDDPSFRDAHAEYLLGEIRDQLLFYFSQDEFNLFLQFFQHLRGKRKFSYAEYLAAFNDFIADCVSASKALPNFFENANTFLQFIYDQNVICFKEYPEEGATSREPFIRWCFRERNLSNMAPKVRFGVDYEIFYGLSKALNVGRTIKVQSGGAESYVGTIITIDVGGGFGFIRGGDRQLDYYFKLADYDEAAKRSMRVSQKVSFVPTVKYGKPRATDVKPAK